MDPVGLLPPTADEFQKELAYIEREAERENASERERPM